jgi:hypothetical protein
MIIYDRFNSYICISCIVLSSRRAGHTPLMTKPILSPIYVYIYKYIYIYIYMYIINSCPNEGDNTIHQYIYAHMHIHICIHTFVCVFHMLLFAKGEFSTVSSTSQVRIFVFF